MLKLESLKTGYNLKNGTELIIGQFESFHLQCGSVAAIIGRNGSGKSTFFYTICGLLPKLSGRILFGTEKSEIPFHEKEKISQKISLVFSAPPKVSMLTAEDIITTVDPREVNFFRTKNMDERKLKYVLELCNISKFAKRLFESLSDGEKQKVMIARALYADTDIICMDEPLAFLDYPGKLEFLQLINSVARTAKKLIIFSSHDLMLTGSNSNNVLLLRNGQMALELSPGELRDKDIFDKYDPK